MLLTIVKFKNKIKCLKILREEYCLTLKQVSKIELPFTISSFYDKDELESMYKDIAEIECEYTDDELFLIQQDKQMKMRRLKYEEAAAWAESLPEKEQEYIKILTRAVIVG